MRRIERFALTPMCLGLILLATACASTGPGAVADRQTPFDDANGARVMVTLPTAAPPLVRRTVQELAVDHDLRALASWTMESLDQECVVFQVPRLRSVHAIVEALADDHRVDLAQPVQRFVVHATPTAEAGPPGSAGQSAPPSTPSTQATVARDYRRFQYAADVLRLDAAHRHATGRGVRLAVIDTGLDLGHPEYHRRIVEARDLAGRGGEGFTDDLHGTAVAGLIAGADDGRGIVGVAPEVDLLALRACWPEPPGGRRAVCDSYTLALAVDFAVTSAARVISLSLGGPDDPILGRLLSNALEQRIIVVAASGGPVAGPQAKGTTTFPASMPGVLAVRCLAREVDPADLPDREADSVAAPGEEILTTTPGGAYDFWNGASMAAAQVSGVAALMLERQPGLTPGRVADVLRGAGHPSVDACAALAQIAPVDCDKP